MTCRCTLISTEEQKIKQGRVIGNCVCGVGDGCQLGQPGKTMSKYLRKGEGNMPTSRKEHSRERSKCKGPDAAPT